jgi:hypothetical protein
MRLARRNMECYAVIKRYGKAFVVLHAMSESLADVYGMHSSIRVARSHARQVNRRIERKRSRANVCPANRPHNERTL